MVFAFPIACPEGAVTRDEVSALDQLKLWLLYNRHYCDHKPSITVYVREHEWDEVGDFVYSHFDEISGVAFLPFDNGTYKQVCCVCRVGVAHTNAHTPSQPSGTLSADHTRRV